MCPQDMSTVDQIKTAASPQHAMLVLAEALDRIEQRQETLAKNLQGYGGPDQWSGDWSFPGEAIEAELLPEDPHDYSTQIAEVQAALAAATGEDRQALEAQLNLLREAAGENVYGYASGNRESTPDGKRAKAEGDDVVIPPASLDRQHEREAWARHYDLASYLAPLGENDALDAFRKGGPTWLYEYDRGAVMQMPYEARVWLVKDISVDSEAQAQELGRDILKSPTSTDQQITTSAILDGAVAGRG